MNFPLPQSPRTLPSPQFKVLWEVIQEMSIPPEIKFLVALYDDRVKVIGRKGRYIRVRVVKENTELIHQIEESFRLHAPSLIVIDDPAEGEALHRLPEGFLPLALHDSLRGKESFISQAVLKTLARLSS